MVAIDADRNPEISLVAFLARRARNATDAHLVVDAVIGFIVAIAALLARAPAWPLFAAAGICFLSFGSWGIADRQLNEVARGSRVWRVLAAARVGATIVGFVAAAFFFMGALGVAIGRVIS